MTQNAIEKISSKYDVEEQAQDEGDNSNRSGTGLQDKSIQDGPVHLFLKQRQDEPGIMPAVPLRDPASAAGDSRGTVTYWRTKYTEPVVMLLVYLKEYNNQGITLLQTREGKPILNFNPGLKIKEQNLERWDLAVHICWLMDEAREDLKQLISNGYLTLPEYKGIWL